MHNKNMWATFVTSIGILFGLIWCGNFFYVQNEYVKLQEFATQIGETILKEKMISSAVIEEADKEYGIKIICLSECQPIRGQWLSFQIEKEIMSFIVFYQTQHLAVTRAIIID